MRHLLMTLLILSLATAAFAQPEQYDMGIFADMYGAASTAEVGPFMPFHFYALAWDLDGQVKGYEFGAEIDPRITITGSVANPPCCYLNLGLAPTNWIIGTGSCIPDAPGTWFWMVDWTGLLFGPDQDVTVCVLPASPTSFFPPTPGYLQCDGTLVPFGVAQNGGDCYPDGCFVVNPTCFPPPIATDRASWGSVKAQY